MSVYAMAAVTPHVPKESAEEAMQALQVGAEDPDPEISSPFAQALGQALEKIRQQTPDPEEEATATAEASGKTSETIFITDSQERGGEPTATEGPSTGTSNEQPNEPSATRTLAGVSSEEIKS